MRFLWCLLAIISLLHSALGEEASEHYLLSHLRRILTRPKEEEGRRREKRESSQAKGGIDA